MIVVDEVEIVNVKGNEVASEETLLELLETMKKMATSKGLDPKEVNKKTKDLAENLGNLSDFTQDNTKALEDNTYAKEDNTDAVKRNTSWLGSMAGYIAGSVLTGLTGFTKELLVGGDNLSDFAKHIPLIGSLIQPLTGYIDESVSVFREMSQVGATFSGGLSEFRRIAGEAAMPLDEFRKLVQENSESLKLFGTDTAMGARNFAAMSNEFRKGPGRELLNLGFTSSELNQTLMDFAEIQSMMFGAERAQSMITTQNAGEFANQLQRLSAITGKRRDQIAEEMMQTMSDARARMAVAGMDADAREKFQANLAQTPEALKSVFVDMADGIPNEEITQRLMQFSDTFRDQAGNIQNMSEREFNNFLVNVRDDLESSGKGMGKGFQAIIASVPGLSDAFASMTELQQRRILGEEEFAKMIEQQKQARERDDSILQFGETLNQIRGDLQVAFINSGIFQTIEELVGNFTDALSDPATMSMIEDGLNTLASGLKTVITAIGSFINDLQYSSLGDAINAFLFGRSEEESKQRLDTESDDLTSRIDSLNNEIRELSMSRADNSDQIAALRTEREGLQDRLSNIDIDTAQATEGILSGFGSDFSSVLTSIIGTAIGSFWESNPIITAMVGGITALWAGSKILGAFNVLQTAVRGVSDLLGNTRGRGGPNIDTPSSDNRDRNKDGDRDRGKGRLRLPGKVGILGAALGAIELGSVLTDDTLTKDEKIEQGSGAAGGMAGGMAGMAAGAALGSVVPLVGTAIGGLVGGTLGYFGGDMLGTAVGESITGGSEEISEEQIKDQASQLKSLQKLANIDLDQPAIEKNLNTLRLYAESMNQIPSIQSAGVFETLRANIVSFIGGDDNPFAPLVAFSNLTLGTNSVKNLESVRLFAEAMNLLPEIKQPGVLETFKASIVSFIGGDNDAFAPLVSFSNLTLGTNSVKNLESVRLFAEAMNLLPEVKQPGVLETVKASIASLFGADNDAFAPLVAFSNLDLGTNAVSNARVLSIFSTAMNQMPEINNPGIFGSIRSGIASLLGGDNDAFASLVAFSNLDLGTNAVSNARVLSIFSTAIGNMPEISNPGIFESIRSGIASLFGGDNDAFAPLVAFSNLTLGNKVEENSEMLRIFSNAMNQIPTIESPGIFGAIRSSIASLFGADNDAFAPLVAFSNLTLGNKVDDNISSLTLFSSAMNQMPEIESPGIFGAIRSSIASLFGGDNDAFAPLVAFSNLTLGNKFDDNIGSLTLFSSAMNQMPEIDVARTGGFFEAIRSLFSGKTVMPWDQVREFGEVDINVEGVTANASAMQAFGNSLSGFSNFETSELDLSDRFTNNLIEISNITGNGLQNIASGLESIVGVTGVRDQLDAINEGLDPAGIRTYTDAIDQLVERLNELNEVLSESNDTLFKDNQSAADVLGNIRVSTQGSSEGISQLNTMLSQMLTVLTQSKEIENKIERNTASLSSDTLSGRVSRMR